MSVVVTRQNVTSVLAPNIGREKTISYQIIAIVDPLGDMNLDGKRELVDARCEERHPGSHILKFWEYGDVDQVKEQTKALCLSLIEAGFYEFDIQHSL